MASLFEGITPEQRNLWSGTLLDLGHTYSGMGRGNNLQEAFTRNRQLARDTVRDRTLENEEQRRRDEFEMNKEMVLREQMRQDQMRRAGLINVPGQAATGPQEAPYAMSPDEVMPVEDEDPSALQAFSKQKTLVDGLPSIPVGTRAPQSQTEMQRVLMQQWPYMTTQEQASAARMMPGSQSANGNSTSDWFNFQKASQSGWEGTYADYLKNKDNIRFAAPSIVQSAQYDQGMPGQLQQYQRGIKSAESGGSAYGTDIEKRNAAARDLSQTGIPTLENAYVAGEKLLEAIDAGDYGMLGPIIGSIRRIYDPKIGELTSSGVFNTLQNLKIANLAPVSEKELEIVGLLAESPDNWTAENIGALRALLGRTRKAIEAARVPDDYYRSKGTMAGFAPPRKEMSFDADVGGDWQDVPGGGRIRRIR